MLPSSAHAFVDLYDDLTVEDTPEQKELEQIQGFFYESPIIHQEVTKKPTVTELEDVYIKDFGGTPLFKQLRIKTTNYFKTKAHEEYLEEKRLQAEELKKFEEELEKEASLEDIQTENLKNFFDVSNRSKEKKKFTFFKKDKQKQEEQRTEPKEQISEETKPQEQEGIVEEVQKIEGGVRQIEADKDVILDCEIVNYIDQTSEVEALGRPTLKFPAQDVSLAADRITYNTEANIIKAFGNIEIEKDGQKMTGDYLQINMNEENSFITNLTSPQPNVTIYAKKANATDDMVILEDGKLASEHTYILKLKTHSNRVKFERMVIPEAGRSHLEEIVGNTKIKIVAENIKVSANDESDIFRLENATVQADDTKLFKFKNLSFHTNKNHNYVESDIFEIGSRSRVGIYAGPGYVFDAPWGAAVKVMPIVNFKDEVGIGGALRYSSATNRTQMVYGSANDIFVMRGRQNLDDRLFFHYGVNSYMNDWWMGQRMAKYNAELIYADGHRINDFLGDKKHLTFRERVSVGYIHDSDVNRHSEEIAGNDIGTMRFKYMSQITQSLYSYHNHPKRLHLNAGVALQGSAALYGTGDTQFIGRIGPYVRTQYKYWMQDIGYFQSTFTGESPIPRFDLYRYGKSNVYFREAIRVNKYLILAYAGSLNLSNDSPNNKTFQENAFIVAFGPDDFKVSLGYDFVRKNTYFNISLALDTKGSSVEYDKLEISHPEKLGKSDKKYVQPVEFPEDKPIQRPAKRKFAQVVDIEDPNREQI